MSDAELINMNKTLSVPSKNSNLGPGSPSQKDVLKMKKLYQQRSWGNAANSILSWRYTISICLLRTLRSPPG